MPESQNPNSLNLILENIGPIKSAEIELGRVTVLYGANATGKTTVARVLEDAVKLMNNIGVECSELAELVRHDAKVGRIVLNDYEVSLERGENVNVVIKRGAELHKGECKVGSTYLTGLHIAGELGVDTLVWVGYRDVRLIGVVEGVLNLEALLKPSIKKYFLISEKVRAAEEYNNYIYNINHRLSSLCGSWIEVQDEVFFNDGDFYYELNHMAEGVRRATLIIAAKVLAEMLGKLGRKPVLFVEGLEPLHVDMIEGILDELSEGNVPVIVETHSGFAIKYGARKSWSVYVLKDGSAFNDLTKPELFSSEAVVASEVGEVL
jgi:energy-coupling factor transporter ATP-binding protein EcfA2